MNFLADSIAILERTPASLNALLRHLPETWTEATDGPGTWSAHTVIGHLIHCEKADWIPRLALILDHGPSRPFDPLDREAQLSAPRRPLPELLDDFAALRAASLQSLRARHLTASQLEQIGTHPAFGLVTARQLIATWTAHDLSHIVQISRTFARRYQAEVGPWSAYLSVMR